MKCLAAFSDDQLGKSSKVSGSGMEASRSLGTRCCNASSCPPNAHTCMCCAKARSRWVYRWGARGWKRQVNRSRYLEIRLANRVRQLIARARYTFAEIHPGDGLVELSYPTEEWVKSLQSPAEAAKWGKDRWRPLKTPMALAMSATRMAK